MSNGGRHIKEALACISCVLENGELMPDDAQQMLPGGMPLLLVAVAGVKEEAQKYWLRTKLFRNRGGPSAKAPLYLYIYFFF